MITILLVIIAVGVLLISEDGKKVLSGIFKLALIGGVLYMGFWVIVFGYVFITSDNGQSLMEGIGSLLIVGSLIFGIYLMWKTLERTWKERKQIPAKIERWWYGGGKRNVRNFTIFILLMSGFFIWSIWMLS